jgi:hypothetical protein
MKLATRCLWGRLSTVIKPLRHQTRHVFAGLLALFASGGIARAQDFQITTLTASNPVVVEVNGIVGDDRGGIAVSTSQAFLSGDGTTARFNRDTLGSSVSLGVVRDSLCSNLRDGTVYLLGNGSTPIGYGGGTVTTLIQLDGTTGAVTTNVLTLSTSISFSGSSSSMGIFSGWDRIVLHNSTRVYRISLPSGTVTDLGAMGVPQRTSSESWAYWGVAENVGSDTYIVCVQNSTTIARTKVPSGTTTTVATFNNLSDMASFTVAPALGRWYFHHESGSQFGSFSESLGYATATFVTPPSAPEIVVQPSPQAVIETESVSLSVSANGTAPLAYQWRKDGSAISGATNNIYSLASAATADAGNYSVIITNSAGSVTSSVVALTVSTLNADLFKILSLKTNNFVVTDPLNYTGDDRGGLVATDQKVFLRGDDSVGSVNFDLSGGTRVGTNTGGGGFNAYTYDSLVSDLRPQRAYVLANGSTVLGIDGGTATTLMEIHGTNGVPTGTNITLSSSIVLPSSGLYSARVGIFSGWGRIILHNDTNAYVINTADGSVTNLGAMARPTRQASESWAYWGVAEYWGGNHYMVYARDAQTIVRTKIPDGTTTVISTFNNLYDMASFTVVPHLSRWYFHDETVNQFTNYGNYGVEILGYADASLLFQAVSIMSQPQSLTVTVGATATFSVTANTTVPGATLTYQWKKGGVAISGATNATLSINNAQGSDAGTYSVTVNGGGAPADSAGATLTVLPNAAPVFTVPGTVTINEDAGAQTNYVTAIGPGAAHETNQTLTVTASSSATNLTGPLTVSYAGGTTASITFTPVTDAFGSATITVIIADNGGTASGSVDRTTNSYTVNVTSVNDPPSATLLTNNVVVLEDSGDYSGAILNNISAGPANEGQSVTITTTNNNPALFASNPAISAAGVLTFTPATNANGSATVSYVLSDGVASVTNSFTLGVTAVNDAPVANAQGVTLLEDIAQAITLTGSDVENSPLTYTVVTGPTNGALSGTAPNLTYTPNTNFFGGDSFTFKVNDGTVDSTTATVGITVTSVNDTPTVTLLTNSVVVLEDGGATTISNFAAYASGPANEAGQAITNVTIVSVTNSALFSAGPVIGTDGMLTFTPAQNANGTALVTFTVTDDGGTANGGVNTSAGAAFLIAVTGVNDAPTVTLLTNNVLVLEDNGANTVSNFAAYATGPANESGQTVTNVTIVSVTNSALFSAGPVIGTDGTLAFTPALNANGTALVTFTVTDDGGTANGGANTSANVAFLISVTGVNDAPGITFATNNLIALEDSGANTVSNFAAYATGPANESGQSITNVVTSNDNAGLFGVQPSVNVNGTLTFTPAANASGVATVTVVAQDDGGTDNGGANRVTNSFLLTVTGVNDAPVVTLATNVVAVLEDAGPQAWTNFALFAAPASEAGQVITNVLVSNNNSNLFSAQPSVTTNGTLVFMTALNAHGSAVVSVVAQDDGGTANGGVDLSAPVTFTITVAPVNDAPVANAGSNQLVNFPQAVSLTGSASDVDTPANGLSFTWSYQNGPGTIFFDDETALATTATFSTGGVYVIRLSVSDGELMGTSDVTVFVNQAPVVYAGTNQTVTRPAAALLSGSVEDDGLPVGASLSLLWSKLTGPGTVNFGTPNQPSTTATFSKAGTYVLQLLASDTSATGTNTVTIEVLPSPNNLPPLVHAGADLVIGQTNRAVLTGRVADDDFYGVGYLGVTWEMVSGPTNGAVTFTDGNAAVTTAVFSEPGSYVLRLTGDDGEYSASDEVTVTIYLNNLPPIVDAGPDVTVSGLEGRPIFSAGRGTGRILVNHDEWTLSDAGFDMLPDTTTQFALNVANWFTRGRPGRFLAWSDNFGLTGTSLAGVLTGAGH